MYDVIISGAGPSGSKCAETLAKAGFRVALIEKNSNWRKPCGGAVSSRIFKYYPQLRKSNYLQITGMNLYSADYNLLKYSWKNIRDYSINVDRLLFDNIIREAAVDAGAELFDKNFSFDFLSKNRKLVGIKTKTSIGTEEYLGKIIIIADGMSSKLALKSGLREKWNINEIGIGKCAILEGENNLKKDCMYLFFKPYKGYGWIFPIGEKRLNIGCGTWQEENINYNINQLYNEFIREPFIVNLISNTNYKNIWEAAYPLPALGVKVNSLFGENIMIIGDAAGFVSPISGEGIHSSVVSGKEAAETAISALEKECIAKETLRRYYSSPSIKKIIKIFKMKALMVDFFFENGGINFSTMLRLASTNERFKEEVINMFLFNQVPSRELILKIKEEKQGL
ncbi:MAG: geranylgeranyl reductase family protein [Promethearchaeota archaeon]